MTRKEQKQFVTDLTRGIRKTLLERLPRVPEEWDGIELRQWISDVTKNQAVTAGHLAGSRQRAYNETIIRKDLA